MAFDFKTAHTKQLPSTNVRSNKTTIKRTKGKTSYHIWRYHILITYKGETNIGKFEDLTNRYFNRLKVIERDISRNNGKVYWICECKCGKRISVTTSDLKSGHTQSCGCYQKYKASIANKRFNTFTEENDYYKCEVSDGSHFLIDKEDKDKIDRNCWRKDGNG